MNDLYHFFIYIYIYIESGIPSLASSLHSAGFGLLSFNCASLLSFMASNNHKSLSRIVSIITIQKLLGLVESFSHVRRPRSSFSESFQRRGPREHDPCRLSEAKQVQGRTSLMLEGIKLPGIATMKSLDPKLFCMSVGMILSLSVGSA